MEELKDIHLHTTTVQNKYFTKYGRHWTSFPADHIEETMRHMGWIPSNYVYKRFDNETEQLVFGVVPGLVKFDVPTGKVNVQYRKVSWKKRFLNWLLED